MQERANVHEDGDSDSAIDLNAGKKPFDGAVLCATGNVDKVSWTALCLVSLVVNSRYSVFYFLKHNIWVLFVQMTSPSTSHIWWPMCQEAQSTRLVSMSQNPLVNLLTRLIVCSRA